MATPQKSKDEIIAERQANLPLPDDPPVASDWQSASASINADAGTKQEEQVGLAAASETGVDRGPASTSGAEEVKEVGRTDRG